jgi:hypothetical protein
MTLSLSKRSTHPASLGLVASFEFQPLENLESTNPCLCCSCSHNASLSPEHLCMMGGLGGQGSRPTSRLVFPGSQALGFLAT